ncbi:hypothetical protein ACFFGV_00890 [Pontibacillus salicampi]|uniref:DUF2178 domain-containing protein n=1 Tax=Pontibacillus salicampi TaxID=1449801 RepID=A0ABV6LID9_9BACI
MKMSTSYILQITVLLLFGWALISFYDAVKGFREMVVNPDVFMFTLDLIPITLCLLVGGTIELAFMRKQRKKGVGWKKMLFLPMELKEEDEREQQITAKACRNAYIAMIFSFPIIAGFLIAQPLLFEYFSGFPIVILLLIPLVQITTYYVSISKSIP